MKNKYSTLIYTCWVVLACCFLVKIFGGNLFEIAVQNEKFINACNFVDDHIWVKMILACVTFVFSGYISLCIVMNEKILSRKNVMIFLPIMIIKSFISWYYPIVAFCLDVFTMFILPLLLKVKLKRVIVTFVLVLLFQFISLIIRNIGIKDFNINNTLISLIMQIDYYIMLILYYLHCFKNKEV